MSRENASHDDAGPSSSSVTCIELRDAAATRALGARLAAAGRPGAVVLLCGPLGAGKTTLVEGLTSALGAVRATSPSFVLVHRYEGGRIPIWHLDLYRLETQEEVTELDLAQYLTQDSLTVCEWPERAAHAWPVDSLTIDLSYSGAGRLAAARAGGPISQLMLEAAFEEGSVSRAYGPRL